MTTAASTPTFPRATPESQGVPSAAVLELAIALSGLDSPHGFVLVRHGHIVAEADWAPYRADEPHHVWSVSKSFTSTAVGFAITEGLFGLDDRVVDLFPESAPAVVDERLAELRVRHLLSMSSGHRDDTLGPLLASGDADWVAEFLAIPLEFAPGTHFLYNTGATFVLSALVQKASGLRLVDYLEPRLFEPLGIVGATWRQNPRGIDLGGFGLSVRVGDIAALGELYLRRGRWGDRQLLPADWVDDATSAHSDNSAFDSTAEWQQGYGYQFWLGTHGYRADGAFGQYCVVLPEADAVLAITGSMAELPMPLYPVWDGLLPALADDPLPEAPAAVTAMHEALARLSVPAPQGVRATEAARRVFGARFGLDQNAHGFETLELRPDDEGATLMLSVAGRDEAIGIGHRQWRRSAVELWPGEGLGIAARGGWVGEREFQARIVSTTSPTAVNLTLQFPNDDTVELTLREHVSFNPIVPLVVGGTRAP